MNEEFIVMFETLIEIIEFNCNANKEYETDTGCTMIGDILDQADVLLKKARGY